MKTYKSIESVNIPTIVFYSDSIVLISDLTHWMDLLIFHT